MRRKWIPIVGGLALALAVAVLFRSPPPHAPRFLPWAGGGQIGDGIVGFQLQPSEGGDLRVWLFHGTSRSNAVLLDVDRRAPLGQLTNAIPVAFHGDQLLRSQDFDLWPWAETLARVRKQPTRTRYWLLNLKSNEAVYLGKLPENRMFELSAYEPSPDGQRGLLPGNIYRLGEAHGLDWSKGRLCRWSIPRPPAGWWDATHLLWMNADGDILLHDVTTDRSAPLVDNQRISRFLRTNNLAAAHGELSVTAQRMDRGTAFHLTMSSTTPAESFLVELAKPDGRMILRNVRFRSEPNGQFDSSGGYYLYDEDSRPGADAIGALCGGLTARDLRSGSNIVVVPTDSTRRFFGRYRGRFQERGGVVYYARDQALARAPLDGSRQERIFPPEPGDNPAPGEQGR